MNGLIIAGGLGMRLRPLTDRVPKSLLPIANRPMLEHQVALLARHGVSDITLLTGFLAGAFDGFVRTMEPYGIHFTVSTESAPLGTAGAVRSRLEHLDGTTIVLNGDVIAALDVGALLDLHRARAAAVTIALTFVEDSSSFGVVPLDDDARVRAFVQNPKADSPMPGDWINAGVYAIEPRVLDPIPPEVPWSFEDRLFPSLVAKGEPVYGFRSDAYWIDIGNPERYLRAHRDVLEGRAPSLFDGRLVVGREPLDAGEVVGPSLVDGIGVGAGAVVGPLACVGPGCTVGEGARVERSVLHAGARIGAGAVVRDAIVGAGAHVSGDLDGQIAV